MGNVCIEAGLAGVAVIASNIDGLPEIVEHGETGILISPTEEISESFHFGQGGVIPQYVISPRDGNLIKPLELNPIAIKSALEKLRKNPDFRAQLADNLQKKVIREFSFEAYNKKLLKIYDEF